ncbi:hypothetical protein HDE_04845 [Halotydeus destructor]|nr:hypothetical protein HDE_04845 [Halotydeus destructor]
MADNLNLGHHLIPFSSSCVDFDPSNVDISSLPSFEGIDMEQLLSDIELHVARETGGAIGGHTDHQQRNSHQRPDGGHTPVDSSKGSPDDEVITGDDCELDSGFSSDSVATPPSSASSDDFDQGPFAGHHFASRPKMSRGSSLSSNGSTSSSSDMCTSPVPDSDPSTSGDNASCRPSPSVSPPLNSDPFLSFTGSSLLDTFGCGHGSDHAADSIMASSQSMEVDLRAHLSQTGHCSVWDSPPSSSTNSFDEALELSDTINGPAAAMMDDTDDFPLLSDDSIWDTFINSKPVRHHQRGQLPAKWRHWALLEVCPSQVQLPPPLPLNSSLATLLQQKTLPVAKGHLAKPAVVKTSTSNAATKGNMAAPNKVTHMISATGHLCGPNGQVGRKITLGNLSTSSLSSLSSHNNKSNTLMVGTSTTVPFTINRKPLVTHSTLSLGNGTKTGTAGCSLNSSNGSSNTPSNTVSPTATTTNLLGSSEAAGGGGSVANQLIFTGNGKIASLSGGHLAGNGSRTASLGANHIIINYSDLGVTSSKNGQVTLSTASGKNLVLTTSSSALKRPLTIGSASLVTGGAPGGGTLSTVPSGSVPSSVLPNAKRLKDSNGLPATIRPLSSTTVLKPPAVPGSGSVLMNLLVNGEDVVNGYTRPQMSSFSSLNSSRQATCGAVGNMHGNQRPSGGPHYRLTGGHDSGSTGSAKFGSHVLNGKSKTNNGGCVLSDMFTSSSSSTVTTDPLYSMSCSNDSLAIGVSPFGDIR